MKEGSEVKTDHFKSLTAHHFFKLGEHPEPLEPIISEKNQLKRSMIPFDHEGGVGGQN